MDPDKELDSGNRYTVQITVKNKGQTAEVNAAPTPYETPPQKENIIEFDNSIGIPEPLTRHVTQDVVGTKFNDSHFRPCLPVEGPLPSGCTPRNIWRPCWPPEVLTSGKRTRTFDKLGSTWASFPSPDHHEQEPRRSFNRNWVMQAAKAPNNRRAGKVNDIQGSLLFPGDKIHTVRPIRRSHGKNVGDVVAGFSPSPGDIYILPCIGTTSQGTLDPRGYVGFVNNSHEPELEGGIMVLRMIKFRDSMLKTRKRMKLFLLTTNLQWRLRGTLDTRGYLEDISCENVQSNYKSVPVRYRGAIQPNTSDFRCVPQRGDVIIREPWKDLFPHRYYGQTSLMWWQPNLELDINDILVRACVWQCCNKFEGFVDLHHYNGKGLRWVFLGRDETVFETATFTSEFGSD